MSVSGYYQEELTYLRETGAVFASENPRLTSFLGTAGTDPDVDRLIESFAFLVARLRQRMEGEMPEAAFDLLSLLVPQAVRPIAPITTLQFELADKVEASSIFVPRGTEVQSAPIGGEPVVFRTTRDLDVLPFRIEAAEMQTRGNASFLSIEFSRRSGRGLEGLGVAPLTLFLNGMRDANAARALYLFLQRKLTRATFTPHGQAPQSVTLRVEPIGFSDKEEALSAGEGFEGYRIVQEYFACPEVLMALRIGGLERFAGIVSDGFRLDLEFDAPFVNAGRLTREMLALNCVPAINLFETDGQALTVAHDRSDYRILPGGSEAQRSVHAVTSVVAWREGGRGKVEYLPFEKYRHSAGRGPEGEGSAFYRLHIRRAATGSGLEHRISLVDRHVKDRHARTMLSLRVLCSNGPLVEKLGPGAINRPTVSTPTRLKFSNITPVLPEIPPPMDDEVLWTLVSTLSRNYAPLVDIPALRSVIQAYDFRARWDRRAAMQRDNLLKSLVAFEKSGTDFFVHGRPMRGHDIRVSLHEDKIGGEGELFLFGAVMMHFLRAFASLNSLYRFTIHGVEKNTTFDWSVLPGGRPWL